MSPLLFRLPIVRVALVAAVWLLGPSAVFAQTGTAAYWDSASGTGVLWGTSTDWSPNSTGTGGTGVVPTSTYDAYFNGSADYGTTTVQLGATAAADGLYFNNTGTTLLEGAITSETLSIGIDGITVASGAGAVTLGSSVTANLMPISITGSQIWTNNSTTNALNVVSAITSAATAGLETLSIAGAGNTTLGGVIGNGSAAGIVALSMTGTGKLTLSAANAFTGGTTISSGTIVIGNASAFGTGALTLNGGAITSNTTYTVSNPIVAIASTTTNLYGYNGGSFYVNYSGMFTGSGTIQSENNSGSLGNALFSGNISAFTGTFDYEAGSGGENFQFNGSGAALNGSNAHFIANGTAGGSTVFLGESAGGTFQAGDLSGSANVTFLNGGTIQIGALGTNTTFSGNIENDSGTTNVTKVGTGTLTLGGSDGYTGATTADNGTLSLTGSISSSSTLVVGGGTFSYAHSSGGSQTVAALTVAAGNSTINAASGDTLTLGSGSAIITRNVGGAVNFNSTTTGTIQYTDTTNSDLTNGLLGNGGGWATYGSGTGMLYATTSGVSSPYTISGYSGATADNTGTLSTVTSATTNYSYSAAAAPTTNVTANTLQYTGAASATTLGTNILQVNGLMNSGTGLLTISGTGTLGAQPASTTIGELVITGSQPITINAVIGDNTASTNLTDNLTGATLTLGSTNTYTGQTFVGGGTLSIGSAGNLGAPASANAILNLNAGTLMATGAINLVSTGSGTPNFGVVMGAGGGTFDVSGSSTLTIPGTVSGSGTLTKIDTGTLTLSGPNTYTGNTIISQGTLIANNTTALGATSNAIILGNANTGSNPVQLTIGTGVAGAVTVGSVITSNYGTSQTILLNAGSSLGANGSELTTAVIELAGSVPLTIEATNTGGHSTAQDIDAQVFGTGIPAGTTALTLNGISGSTLRWSIEGAGNDFTGNVLIEGTVITQDETYTAQTAQYQNLGFRNNDITVSSGASWQLVWGGETIGALNGSGGVSLNNQNALNSIGLTIGNTNDSGSFTGNISGGFGIAKVGTGTQVFGGTNTYTGATTVVAGTLQFAVQKALYNDNSAGSGWTASDLVVQPGATAAFNVGGTNQFMASDIGTLAALGGASNGFESGSFIGLDTTNAPGGFFVYTNALANPNGGANVLGLTKLGSGALVLTSANTYSGVTTISAGTLQIGSGADGGSLGTGNVVNNSALTFELTSSPTFSNAISGTGSVSLISGNTGTITLTGANTYTGGTTITAGTLGVGTIADSGTSNIGTSGTLTLAGGTLRYTGVGTNTTGRNISLTANSAIVISGSSTANLTITSGVSDNTAGYGLTLGAGSIGTLTLAGTNAYSGATNVNAGTLRVTGSLASTQVNVNSGGTLAGSGDNSTSGIINGNVQATGGTIALAGSSSTALTFNGGATLGNSSYTTLSYVLTSGNNTEPLDFGTNGAFNGTLTIGSGNAYVVPSSTALNGTYVLANFGSLAGAGAFTLSTSGVVTSENVGRNSVALSDTGTQEILTVIGASVPTVAYWYGGAGSFVWNGTTATATNWASSSSGTTDAGNIPGSVTDVFLNANVPPATGTVSTTLGISTTINSLNVTQYGANTIADGNSLTINALADTGSGGTVATAGNAINVANGANAFTIDAPLVMGGTGASQTYTNASASPFTINGTVTGTAIGGNTQTLTLVNTSSGSTTLVGAISDVTGGGKVAVQIDNTGSGVTYLQGSNTFSGGLTLTAGTLSISGGTSSSLGAGNVTINGGTLDLAGATTIAINNLAGTGGDITSSVAGASPTFANSATTSFAGTIDSGFSGGITVSGPGILALTGSNGYTGGTLLSGGTLRTNTDASLGNDSGALTFNGGTLQLTSSYSAIRNYTINSGQTALIDVQGYTLTDSGVIGNASGTGGLTLSSTGGGGTLVLNNTETYAGPTTVNTGATLRIGSSGVLPANTLAAGANLVLNGTGTLDLGGNSIALTGLPTGSGGVITSSTGSPTLTMNTGGTYGGLLTGSLSLLMTGTSALTLSGANTYTGSATISNGTLILNSNSTADTTGYTLGDSNTGTNNVALQLAGGFNSNDMAGTRLINATVSNQGTGTATISVGSAGTSPDLVLVIDRATIIKGPLNQLLTSISGPGAGAGNTSLTIDVNGGSFVWTSNGTADTFSGNVHIINSSATAGTLQMQNNAYVSNIAADQNLMIPDSSSVTLDSNITWAITWGVETIDGLNGSGTIRDTGATSYLANTPILTVGAAGGSGSFSGVIADSGGIPFPLAKTGAGTQILSGANTYTGATTISGGTLQLGNGGTTGLLATASAIVDNATLAFNETGTGVSALSVGNTISGSGAVQQIGSGTTTLSGNNSYNGGTTINTGTVIIGVSNVGATGALGASTAVVTLGASSGSNAASLLTGGAFTFANPITVASGGSGLLTLGGNTANSSAFSGSAIMLDNNLTVSQVSGGALSIADSITAGISGVQTLTFAGADAVAASNAISDGGGGQLAVVQNGAGTTTLSGNNAYGGGTTINAGTLVAGSTTAFGTATGASLSFGAAGAGTVDLNGNSMTLVGLQTVGAPGAATVQNANGTAATLTVNPSAANVYAGVLQDGSGGGALGLIVGGAGSLTLSGNNTYTGGTTINSGTLSAGSTTAFGTATGASLSFGDSSTGTVNLNGNSMTLVGLQTAGAPGASTVQNANGTAAMLTVNNSAANLYAGVLQDGAGGGALSLIVGGAGSLTLSGANAYSGGTTINAGTLIAGSTTAFGTATGASLSFGDSSIGMVNLNGNSMTVVGLQTIGAPGSSTVQNANAAAATLTINNSIANVYAGVLQDGLGGGPLSLTTGGAGTLTLSGNNNTYTGNTTVNSGALRVSNTTGSATGGGSVNINNTSTLTGSGFITGSVAVGPTAVISPSLAGTSSEGSISQLSVGGLTLSGGSQLNYQVSSTSSLDSIAITSLGALTLPTSGQAEFNFYAPGTSSTPYTFPGLGTYPLISYGSLNLSQTLSSSLMIGAGNNSWPAGETAAFATTTSSGPGILELVISSGIGSATWSSNGSDNGSMDYGTAANWTPEAVPNGAGQIATFGAGIQSSVSITGGYTIGQLNFNNGGNSGAPAGYTLSGDGSLTLDNSGSGASVNVSSGGLQPELGVSLTLTLADSSLTTRFNIAGDGSLDVAGPINQSGGDQQIVLAGGGTLHLDNGGNSYSGGTTVNSGTLIVDPASGSVTPFGSGPLAINGSTSIVNVNPQMPATVVFGSLSGTGGGQLNVGGNATLTVNQTTTSTFNGTLSLNGGLVLAASTGNTLTISGAPTLGSGSSITVNSGTLALTNNTNSSATVFGTPYPTVSVASNATLQLAGSSNVLSSAVNITTHGSGLSTDGILSVVGTSTQTVGVISGDPVLTSPVTTYAGTTTVGDGTNAANLTATQILQNTLTINAGSTVTIAPSGSDIPMDGVAATSAVAASDAASSTASADGDSSSDPFTAIEAAIASGSISSAKGQQLENRIAAIERLAATDPGLDVSLLEDRVLAALPATSVWSSSGTSPLIDSGSGLLAVDGNGFVSSSDAASGSTTAAFAPAADFGGSPAAVPEPSTLLLAVLGSVSLVLAAKRRRRC